MVDTLQCRKAASALRFQRPFPGSEWNRFSNGCTMLKQLTFVLIKEKSVCQSVQTTLERQ